MSKVDIKSLDVNLSTILKSRNRQIMLSQIRNYSQFTDFLGGPQSIQVITANKSFFNAFLAPCEDTQSFVLDPQGSRPPVHIGEHLLLLFQTQRDAVISQAVVTALIGNKVRISAVDPRTNIRYKTRLRSHWSPVTKECWDNFNSHKWTIVRQSAPLDTNTPGQTEWLAREFALEIGSQPIDLSRVIPGGGSPQTPGLLVDLSLGGTCLMVAKTPRVDRLRDNFFIYIEIPVPHVVQDLKIGIFAVARHIRVWQEWAVIHCMFVEKLAPETLIL